MKHAEPTLEEWRALYAAADEFQKLAPWRWMWDRDIFGVKNSESGEINYSCIMGAGSEHFAFASYRGTAGLKGLGRLSERRQEDDEGAAHEIFNYQDCLMASFDSRQFLEDRDVNVIKKLGRKYKISEAWPKFESFSPGFVPWRLTGKEARELTESLVQSIHVAKRFKTDEEFFHPHKDGKIFTRIKDKNGEWKDEWLLPVLEKAPAIDIGRVPPKLLTKMRKDITQSSLVVEADFFYALISINDSDRPYFPTVALLADHDTGFIYDTSMTQKRSEFFLKIPALLTESIEKLQTRPFEILVQKPEVFMALSEVCRALDIKLTLVKTLPNIEEVRRGMVEFFRDGMPEI